MEISILISYSSSAELKGFRLRFYCVFSLQIRITYHRWHCMNDIIIDLIWFDLLQLIRFEGNRGWNFASSYICIACSFNNFRCGVYASFQPALLFRCLFSMKMSIIIVVVVAPIVLVAVVQGVNLSVLFAECLHFPLPLDAEYDEWISRRYVQCSVEQQQAVIA